MEDRENKNDSTHLFSFERLSLLLSIPFVSFLLLLCLLNIFSCFPLEKRLSSEHCMDRSHTSSLSSHLFLLLIVVVGPFLTSLFSVDLFSRFSFGERFSSEYRMDE